jgi:hypothetical protein
MLPTSWEPFPGAKNRGNDVGRVFVRPGDGGNDVCGITECAVQAPPHAGAKILGNGWTGKRIPPLMARWRGGAVAKSFLKVAFPDFTMTFREAIAKSKPLL